MRLTTKHNVGLPSSGLLACLLLAGPAAHCQSRQPANATVAHSAEVLNTVAFDRIVARVPRRQAPTAAVAAAQVKIALHGAKRKAEEKLCQGRWTASGPVFVQNIELSGDSTAWQFRLLRYPHRQTCGEVSRERFFAEMAQHLPEWVAIVPAGEYLSRRDPDEVQRQPHPGAVSPFASLTAPGF